VIRHVVLRRWFFIWLVLLGLSAVLARYFDPGAPVDWPEPARFATGIFLAPGGMTWLGLFWHAFGAGPTDMGLAFIALLNSAIWLLAACTSSKVLSWLRRSGPTKDGH
jgi:hypothetical protein